MPPCGIALNFGATFEFWLMSHDSSFPNVWPAIVLRECLPAVTDELAFEAVGRLLR